MSVSGHDSDDNEMRFRVHKAGNLVKFYGALTDTTTFEPLDHIVVDGCLCDFAELKFASWIGLASMCSYFEVNQLKVSVRNIPRRVFDCLKILDAQENVSIVSAEILCLDRDMSLKECFYELSRLEKIYGNSELAKDGENLIFSPRRFILPANSLATPSITFSDGWALEDNDEATFWVSYMFFVQSSFDLGSTLLDATQINLLELLSSIKTITLGGEKALDILEPGRKHTLVARLNMMVQGVEHSCRTLSVEISEYELKTREYLIRLLQELFTPTDKAFFYEIVSGFFSVIQDVIEIASKFEEAGSHIGSNITKLRVVHLLRSAISLTLPLEGEKLEEIRDAFSILDIMSEDSWVDTKVEILKEIDVIESNIGKCVTTLQSFDLLRQILDHRRSEGETIDTMLPKVVSGECPWFEIKEAVYQQIGRHMVTEQEKLSFAFYLPDGFKKFGEEDRKEPGDVLLF